MVLLKYFEEYVIEFLIFIVFPLVFSVIYVDFEFTKIKISSSSIYFSIICFIEYIIMFTIIFITFLEQTLR